MLWRRPDQKTFGIAFTDLTWPVAFSITAAIIALCTLLYFTPLNDWLDDNLARKLEFGARAFLNQSPTLDPRIKIVAFDDITASALERHDLSLDHWGILIKAIAKQNPELVFIDKIWSLPIGENFSSGVTAEETEKFVEELSQLKIPVVVGGHFLEKELPFSKPIDIRQSDYDLWKWLDASLESQPLAVRELTPPKRQPEDSGKLIKNMLKLEWINVQKGWFYGPHPHIRKAFTHIGHINYLNNGIIQPLIRLDERYAIPHAALLAANKPLNIQDSQLYIGDNQIFLDYRSRLLINFSRPQEYYSRTANLFSYVKKVNNNDRLSINAGDYVIILPLMYTGNVDFKETPVGKLPGGYFVVSLINSALTGEWLKPIHKNIFYSWLGALLGMLLGIVVRGLLFWSALILSTVMVVGASLTSFAFAGIVLPWLLPLTAYISNGVLISALRSYMVELRARRLREALEGSIAPEKLDELIKHSSDFKLEPCEAVVTIMFIDIVHFSLTAEQLSPSRVFSQLKEQLNMLTDTIHKFNGIIDRNLGDGLMCFFGYDYLTGKEIENHAEAALQCAIEIQKQSVQKILVAEKSKTSIYPLRIGINTAPVFIGDIGDSKRVDFTLIGHGVNFASRLESACEPFKIMLGPATKNQLKLSAEGEHAIHKRSVQIKHYQELFEAYEFDPFFADATSLRLAQTAYQRYANLFRKFDRLPVLDKGAMVFHSHLGKGEVVNVSLMGFAAAMNEFLAKGVTISVAIETNDKAINSRLAKLGLMPFTVEVCWGSYSSKANCYLLGFKIKSLNASQCKLLFDCYSTLLGEPIDQVA